MGRAYEVRKASIQKTGAAKSKLYSMYAREIYQAAKTGGVELESNASLKRLVERAKKEQVPSDIIKRAIDKVNSGVDESYSQARYELFGPAGSTVIVDCLTDNVNRSVSSIRAAVNKYHVKMGAIGSVAYQYDHLCIVGFKGLSADETLEQLIEADLNIDDIEENNGLTVVYGDPKDLFEIKNAITKAIPNVEFDMVTGLSPSQTNAIVGIGSSDSSYTGYSQVPIIIRMYRDGKIGAYNGNGYVQSNVEFEKNKKYHLRVSINLEEKTYDVYVTPPQQEEIQIATNYAFRSTAKVPEDIGKIYLFNNEQQAGKYWLEDIYLEAKETDKVALRIALDLANAITDEDLKDVILVVVDEFKAARDNANEVYNNTSATQEEVNNAFDRLASAMHLLDFVKGDKTALKAFIDKVSGLDSTKYTEATWTQFNDALIVANAVYADENSMQEEVDATYQELVTAFLNLRLIPDKSLLEDLINKAEGLNLASYSKAIVQVVNDALANAKNVLANENASQKEVDNAKATLEKAIAGL